MTTQRNGAESGRDQPGARLAEELRLLADTLAERAQPWLNRFAQAPDDAVEDAAEDAAEHTPATCGWCPLCAGLALLRGERPELAQQAAEHAAGLLTVLRAALADRAPADQSPTDQSPTDQSPTPAEPEPPAPRVQHIAVRRPRAGDAEC